jgi:hypothetical protein
MSITYKAANPFLRIIWMMKKIVLGMIIHSYNPSTLVAEAQEP